MMPTVVSRKYISIFGDKFRVEREKIGSQGDLAAAAQMSASRIYKIERAKRSNILIGTAIALAGAMGISKEEFERRCGGAAIATSGSSAAIFEMTSTASDIKRIAGGVVGGLSNLRVYRSVAAARSDSREDDGGGHEIRINTDADFGVVVSGDCMSPKFEDGQTVLVSVEKWKRDGFIWAKCYWVRFTNGETTLKRICRFRGDKSMIEFQPINPAYNAFDRKKSDVELAAIVVGVLGT